MISPRSSFKFVDRGARDTIVLVPGWAADHRVFCRLELPYNYMLCTSVNNADFTDALARGLDEARLESAAVLGWSMGGYLARDFAARYPSRVSDLYLVGMRERYDGAALAEIKKKLEKNRRAFLISFYKDCFSANDAEGYAYFRRELMKPYLEMMTLDGLLAGLDFLERSGGPFWLARKDGQPGASAHGERALQLKMPFQMIHGSDDVIAPVEEGRAVAAKNGADFVDLKGLGHCPFLNNNWSLEPQGIEPATSDERPATTL